MTSKGIAQRLIAKHGQQDALERVEAQLQSIKLTWAIQPPTRTAYAAKLGAYSMLWTSVLHYLKQA